jgi:hypothetical protein
MADLLNATEYAKSKNVSDEAVRKWIKTGKLGPIGDAVARKGRLWLIDPQKADAYYNDNVRMTNQSLPFAGETDNDQDPGTHEGPALGRKVSKGDTPADLSTYHGATAWRAKYEALLSQHEFEIKSGRYVLAEEVKAAAFAKARTLRDMLLTIPDRISPILTAEDDPEKVFQLLTREIKLALEEIER